MLLINWKIHLELNWIEDCCCWWLTDWIVLAYFIAPDDANNEVRIKDNKKHFLSRREINNYNVLIDDRNLYDQPINDLIKQYNKVRKVSTGKGDFR